MGKKKGVGYPIGTEYSVCKVLRSFYCTQRWFSIFFLLHTITLNVVRGRTFEEAVAQLCIFSVLIVSNALFVSNIYIIHQ